MISFSRSSVGQKSDEAEVHALGRDETGPVDCAGGVTESIDELAGQFVLQRGAALDKSIIVFFGSVADGFNNIGVEIWVLANQIPEVLTDDLEVAVRRECCARLAVADAENGLHF